VIIELKDIDFYVNNYSFKWKNSGGTNGGKQNSPWILRTSGGTVSDHIPVIINSYENIVRDV